jgi:hypothetical protein
MGGCGALQDLVTTSACGTFRTPAASQSTSAFRGIIGHPAPATFHNLRFAFSMSVLTVRADLIHGRCHFRFDPERTPYNFNSHPFHDLNLLAASLYSRVHACHCGLRQ